MFWASSTIERASRAAIVPIETLSWLWASVEREWIVVGAHRCMASAVIADAQSCRPLKPWCSPASGSVGSKRGMRLAVRPRLNFSSTT